MESRRNGTVGASRTFNKCHWVSTNHRKMCKSHSRVKTSKFITQIKQKHESKKSTNLMQKHLLAKQWQVNGLISFGAYFSSPLVTAKQTKQNHLLVDCCHEFKSSNMVRPPVCIGYYILLYWIII